MVKNQFQGKDLNLTSLLSISKQRSPVLENSSVSKRDLLPYIRCVKSDFPVHLPSYTRPNTYIFTAWTFWSLRAKFRRAGQVLHQKFQSCANGLLICGRREWQAQGCSRICTYWSWWDICRPSYFLYEHKPYLPCPSLFIRGARLWHPTPWTSVAGLKRLWIRMGCWATHPWITNIWLLVGYVQVYDRGMFWLESNDEES